MRQRRQCGAPPGGQGAVGTANRRAIPGKKEAGQCGAAILAGLGFEAAQHRVPAGRNVLVASGRPPSLEGLDLEEAGLDLDDKGCRRATLQWRDGDDAGWNAMQSGGCSLRGPMVSLCRRGAQEEQAIGTARYADQGRARVEGENHGVARGFMPPRPMVACLGPICAVRARITWGICWGWRCNKS
ncbi:hypothetical protein AYJ57_21900 (plasmid) [Salipiger sp. CCB-MM3]|uniref:hypothetical protein n=1 Tax=Salipiger sp. CCB-MM3 TaxID=1792508 RepID=UPI00080AB13F|nr:hypothetical protein [Salipiger sp. CCB-MM3]ANT63354.1 hypothetical protein AYJ57_21900 [Salipiger sp. CCB-MM3]